MLANLSERLPTYSTYAKICLEFHKRFLFQAKENKSER